MTPRSLDTGKLAERLGDALPAHMMPSFITALDEMPLLFIGDAVDRGALPLPDWGAADAVYTAPINALEAQLQAIFAEVLRRDCVGTQADFFTMGGNDVMARPPVIGCTQACIWSQAFTDARMDLPHSSVLVTACGGSDSHW